MGEGSTICPLRFWQRRRGSAFSSRVFRSETGQPPAKAVDNLRVEAARLLMEEAQHPVDVVARETGFSDPERMRRVFLRAFGQPPQAIKRAARIASAS